MTVSLRDTYSLGFDAAVALMPIPHGMPKPKKGNVAELWTGYDGALPAPKQLLFGANPPAAKIPHAPKSNLKDMLKI